MMINRARELARIKHTEQYNGQSYLDGHLEKVVTILIDFGFDSPEWQVSGYVHDMPEDTDYTIDDVRNDFGDFVADLVFAVSGFGPTRVVRNQQIYEKIAAFPMAAPLKLADRICHIEEGSNPRMLQMYWKEQGKFETDIRPHVPEAMWDRLMRAWDRHAAIL